MLLKSGPSIWLLISAICAQILLGVRGTAEAKIPC